MMKCISRVWRLPGLAAAVLIFPLVSAPALASTQSWVIVPDGSAISFDYETNGDATSGTFSTFEGEGFFDPADPASAELTLRIKTRSIDLNDALASAFAQTPEWFDSGAHPYVIYDLEALRLIDQDRYRAFGYVSIRGIRMPVETEIRLTFGTEGASASGALTVSRTDFGLGVGLSALVVDIGPNVSVRFRLAARKTE